MTILENAKGQQTFVPSSSDYHLVETFYIYRNRNKVEQFLKTHPGLVIFLLDSRVYLRKYFGDDASYSLEVVSDFEGTNNHEELFVNISTNMLIEDALNQLDELDRSWYFENIDWIGSTLNYSLEIQ
jgi:hypothetical protein